MVNFTRWKDKEYRGWPLVVLLLPLLVGVCCLAGYLFAHRPLEAQSRFVNVSLHPEVTANYNQNPNPPQLPPVSLDIIWDAILDREPDAAAELAVRKSTLLAGLDAPIPVSSSACRGTYTIPVSLDTWIDSTRPTLAAGDDTILQVARSSDNELKRILLFMPVTDYLPPGTFIAEARLELRPTDPTQSTPNFLHIYNLKSSFDETTTHWLNQPETHIDSLPPAIRNGTIHTWDVTAIVRSWLLGHYANNGLMVELPSGSNLALRYFSREADTRVNFEVDDAELAPRIVIDCGPPQAVAQAPAPPATPTPSPGPEDAIPPAAAPPNSPTVQSTTTALASPTPVLATPTLPPASPTPTILVPTPTATPLMPTPTPLPTATPIPPTSRPPTSPPPTSTPTATPVPLPQNQADVAITQSDSPDPVMSGGVLTYNFNVTNNGPDQATGVTVTDSLPAGVTLLTIASGQGSCSGTTCNLGSLANGGSTWVTLQVRVNAASGTLNNTVTVSANETDPVTGNNSASANTAIASILTADMEITKTDSPDPVLPGNNLTYTLNVRNNGPDNATAVTVVDTLPAGVTLVSATWPAGSCTGSTTLTCNIGNLANGSSETITIVVTVNAASGSLSNTTNVSGNEVDPDLSNNTAGESTTVTPVADLSIVKNGTPATVVNGNNITYPLVVNNNGPSDATGVVVTDTLPAGITLVNTSISCSGSTTLVCNLGDIPSGDNATFTIVVNVDAATSPGTLVNTVVVGGNEVDPDGSNDSDTAAVDVIPSITIGDVSRQEGDSGTTGFDFAVSLSSSTSQVVTVTFATADDSATLADNDYVANSGVVVFPAGTMVQTITVQVNGDTTVEPDETFLVNLSSPVNAAISDSQGIGTIENDDLACTQTITLTAAGDTWLQSSAPDNNQGGATNLNVKPDSSQAQRALIQFDLSSISAGTTLCAADLLLYENDSNTDQTIYIHRVTTGWSAATATWNSPWATPGGDYVTSEVTTFAPDSVGLRTISVTSLAQYWVDNSANNRGLLMRSTTTGDEGEVRFNSLEEGSDPPRLIIQY